MEPTRPVFGKTLLIVDDEPQIRRMFERLLSRHFGSVITAGTAEEGAHALKTRRVTHLVVDYHLGPCEPCGEYLISVWRAKHPDIERALLVTGDEMKCDNPAIDGCFIKTVDPLLLMEALSAKP